MARATLIQETTAQELRGLRRAVNADTDTMKAALERLGGEDKAAKKRGGSGHGGQASSRVCSEEVDAFLREVCYVDLNVQARAPAPSVLCNTHIPRLQSLGPYLPAL